MRIVCTKEMKEIESATFDKYHFDESLVVENVGIQGAKYFKKNILKNIPYAEVLFLVGKGSNGADGLAIARHLSNCGVATRAFTFFNDDEFSDEMKKQLQIAKSFGVKVNYIDEIEQFSAYFSQSNRNIVVVDAIFGTGVRLPLSNFHYDIIKYVNTYSEYTVAIDIPTGVEGDTGFIQGNAIQADVTFAIGVPKLGYFVAEGAKLVGEVETLDVGFPKELLAKGDKFLLNVKNLRKYARRRNRFADKKNFGHTLVIGGSHGLTGALVLASQAGLKVGAGLVTAATWENQYHEFIARLIPEIMTGYIPLDTTKWNILIDNLDTKYDSIVIGPGLARSTRARKLTLEVLNNFTGPVVLDADAINVLNLKEDAKVFSMRNGPTVLTPHFGEFARFCGISVEELEQKPVDYIKQLVDQINCSVVLKGACTYLGFPDGKVYFNNSPNDGMATGGAGDVLAGILGGLLGQEKNLKKGQELFNRYEDFNRTVSLGVLVHSYAGRFAAEKLGVRAMSASSIIDSFSSAFKLLDEHLEEYLTTE